MNKTIPQFTWYQWGKGAEHWGPDDRGRCASILRWARKDRRFSVEVLDRGFYRVKKDDVMALIRTR
jgi:hypothetical protein